MLFSRSYFSLLLALVPFSTATPGVDELILDQSCLNFGKFGDVTKDLNQAYKDARTIAADAHTRIDNLRKTLAGATGLLDDTEILRLERLLAAFFISPFKDASSPPLGRTPDNPGYEKSSSDLEQNLALINIFGISTMPPMFCDPPTLTQDEAAGLTTAQKKGKFVKITKNPDGTNVVDSSGKPSFYLEDYLVGPNNSGFFTQIKIGQDPCNMGAIAATNGGEWMLWCGALFQKVRSVQVPTDPKQSENQNTDFSGLSYKLSAKGQINYWRTSIGVTMLHEMHHVYVVGSTDVIVKIKYPSQESVAAYAYSGTTQLAENVRVSGLYDTLGNNADQMAIWAIAAFLKGSDWSLYNAKPLKTIGNTVTTPPPGGIPKPKPKLRTTRRRGRSNGSASGGGASISVDLGYGRSRRNGGFEERRYVERRSSSSSLESESSGMAERFGGLGLPMSPAMGGREI